MVYSNHILRHQKEFPFIILLLLVFGFSEMGFAQSTSAETEFSLQVTGSKVIFRIENFNYEKSPYTGMKAIPGQTVDEYSISDLKVGAFCWQHPKCTVLLSNAKKTLYKL